ncbi:HEPN domain-containing protein [Stenotrophomonas sp. BIGb0135]|uniref:HEPN domain-containing protein n=1 Tax=Stenotrophomonas sp. BIGb0135 TaxID=2940620 RepID=UPI002166C8B6|nr:HEPN domain-containing protein [Stenotrophomonas sp. BIGb0135]MCS4233095.1 hypothetical protein [Stenotrophomonas sp. BIGb0135]
MSIDINPGCKVRLIEQLSSELRGANVYCDAFIYGHMLHGLRDIRSLPDKGNLAEELRLYVGESAFEVFVADEIRRHFKGPGFNPEGTWSPLTSVPGYEDVTPMATAIVESFCTLPWTYHVCVRLPDVFRELLRLNGGRFQLSEKHIIISGAQLRKTHELPPHANPGLKFNFLTGTRHSDGWEDEAGYLQVEALGYYRNALTEPILSARDDVLSFFGLGLALGLFVDIPIFDLGARPEITQLFVHCLEEGRWQGPSFINLDEQHIAGIQTLSTPTEITDDPALLAERLNRIGTVFTSKLGEKIRLSARWLFDSHCGRDQLLAYVQAAASIEILLGDDDQDASIGLTTLMANRCAYLIAKTPTARSDIIDAFREIYKIRSKIVHTGKNRLNRHEVSLFHYLQHLIYSVINEEQRHLERDHQRGRAL